jgi:hypothetical protein
MRLLVPSSLAALLLLSSCAARAPLTPAPEARVLPQREQAVVANVGDVLVTADASAWKGYPSRLEAVVPVRVRIENGGQVPLRLRFADFTLRLEEGVSVAALPPVRLEGTEIVTAPPPTTAPPGAYGYGGAGLGWVDPLFVHRGFHVAAPYGLYYPGLSPWTGPFALGAYPYAQQWRSWPVELPTPDMVARALPEGVLEPDGMVEGFIYFQGLPGDEQRAILQVELADARTGEALGRAILPFEYHGR